MIRLLIFLILSQICYAQEIKKPWRADDKLVWSDFKGKIDTTSIYAANTYSGISYRYSAKREIKKTVVKFEVSSYFIGNKSWVKEGFKADKTLLTHEQLHFDITELYARKLRQKLKTTRFTVNAKKQIETVYKKIAKERVRMQKLYDEETNHSKNEVLQKKWEIKIAVLLKKLQYFESK